LLTQCPSCQTTFRVTSEILRVAHGQVRCGRCQTQFDALERLIEEAEPGEESGRFIKPPRHGQKHNEFSAIEVEEPDEQEDITLEGRHIEITGTYRVLDDADESGAHHVRQEVTEEWAEVEAEDIEADEVGDDAISDENPDATVEEAEEVEETEGVIARAARLAAAAGPREQIFTGSPRFASRRRPVPVEEEEDDFAILGANSRAPGLLKTDSPQSGSLKWKLLLPPLLLVLVAQVIHHYRSDLARHPQIGAPLMNLYGGLHLPLTPDWNLHAYEIKQWGVLADPAIPGTLKVRASITNRAAFAQPYPLLKLVLEDRWGDQVRAREFEPAEYLDAGTAADRLLGPQQQTNATINIVDPGPDAEGFRFDVCLRGRAGPVCAAEVPE
jgi:predicted Zn finger-like uncharacterized protein